MSVFFPPLVLPLFIFFIVIPFFALTYFFATTQVFSNLFGITKFEAMLIFSLAIIGSFVNIPIYEVEGRSVVRRRTFFGIFYYYVERRKIVVAVNVGGAVIPSILAAKLTFEMPLAPVLSSVLLSTVLIYFFAKPVPEVGIAVPLFIPPLIALMSSSLAIQIFGLSYFVLPKLAFASGVFGSIIGADVLHLKDIEKIGSGVVSIGGAGTFDGIFLTGVFSVIFSYLLL